MGVLSRVLYFIAVSIPALEAAGTPCAFHWQCSGRCGSKWQCEDGPNGHRCLLHDDCKSHYCTWKFKCADKKNDGADLGWPAVDYRPCKSKNGKCGYCGSSGMKLKMNQRCTWDKDCETGVCGRDGHLTAACLGRCKPKMNDGDKCDNDFNCKSGFCSDLWLAKDHKDLSGLQDFAEVFIRRCTSRKPNGHFVGKHIFGSNDFRECKSGHSTCGYCTENRDYQNKNGQYCSGDRDCSSRLCAWNKDAGVSKFCMGKCESPREDGHFFGFGPWWNFGAESKIPYNRYCKSKEGVCGTCAKGRKNGYLGKCADSSDCKDGLFCGRSNDNQITTKVFCGGTCKKKVADGEECDSWWFDMNGLHEGESEGCAGHNSKCVVLGTLKLGQLGKLKSVCHPPGGGIDGHECMLDSECAKDYWCRDGDIKTNGINRIGRCSRCPERCGKAPGHPRGCTVCGTFPQDLTCGERSWTEEGKCFLNGLPKYFEDAASDWLTCVGSLGNAGFGQDTPAPGSGLLGVLGDQKPSQLVIDCVKDGECDIELFHHKTYHLKEDVDNGHLVDMGRRRLAVASGVENPLALPAPELDMKPANLGKYTVQTGGKRTFGVGSRRRLEDEKLEVDDSLLGLFDGKSIDELVRDVHDSEKLQYRQDLEEYVHTRKKLLAARESENFMESDGFDGDVGVEEHFDLIFDPDLVMNPKHKTLKGSVKVHGSMNGKLSLNSSKKGSVKLARPVTGPIPLVTTFFWAGPVPVYIELYFQAVIELRAKVTNEIDATIDLLGTFAADGTIDVDLDRTGKDKIRYTPGKGENNLEITPKNLGKEGVSMDLETRFVARFAFLVFTTTGIQLDHALAVNSKLHLKPVQAPVAGRDCLEGEFQVTGKYVGIRPVIQFVSVDPKRVAHGACVGAVSTYFSYFSGAGLAARFNDCFNKAFLAKSTQARLLKMCDDMNVKPEVIDLSESELSYDIGLLKIPISGAWKPWDLSFCEGDKSGERLLKAVDNETPVDGGSSSEDEPEPVANPVPEPVAKPVPEPVVAQAAGEWRTLFSCEGDGKTADRIAADDWVTIAKASDSLRICTAGSESQCVVSKPGNVALANLRSGNMNLQEAGLEKCDRNCINQIWSGPEDLLGRLTWVRTPNYGDMFYHACGNPDGLHMSRSKSHCEWDWERTSSLVVQVYQVDSTPEKTVEVEPISYPVQKPGPWVECSKEWNTCKCVGEVRYGNDKPVPHWSAIRRGVSGSIKCTNSVFGDSYRGVKKVCQCRKAAPQQPQQPEGQVETEWVTIFGCDGRKTKNRVLAGAWHQLAWAASGVRICNAGSETECVVAKEGNQALKNLRRGEYSLQEDGLTSCGKDCIARRWSGPESLRSKMWWNHNVSRDVFFYQAAGNTRGLHFSTDKDKSGYKFLRPEYCEWSWDKAYSGNLVVQLELPRAFEFPAGETKIAENVCVGARGNAFGKFEVPRDISAEKVRIVHRSGYVHCARSVRTCDEKVFGTKGGQRKSNFGCECSSGLSIFVTDCEDDRILPNKAVSLKNNAWYYMPGFTGHSKELVFGGETNFEAGKEYRVWYGEDLAGYTESDNSGVACYDIYASI